MAKRRSKSAEARLKRAAQAGYRAVRDSLTKGRAHLMRQLGELPRDGSADAERARIIAELDAINHHLTIATRQLPDDEDDRP